MPSDLAVARSPAKVTAPVVAQPVPVALSFAPSDAARAAGHVQGADVGGLLEQLKLQLIETRQLLATVLWLTSPADDQRSLKSLMRKLCWALGSVDLHDPSPTGSG